MRKKTEVTQNSTREQRPGITEEDRENQMIALAINLAEQQLRDGTASSQVITHYLKLGSTKERIERDILEQQKELVIAKTESIKAAKRVDEMYEEAINAMKRYGGHINEPG